MCIRDRVIACTKEERGETIGLAVQATFKPKGRNKVKDKAMVYSHCNRTGHDVANSFQLIGFPDWWGDRPRGDGRMGGWGRGQQ